MKEDSISIDGKDLLFIIRKGLWVSFIFLILGGFISYGWFNRIKETLDVPVYNRSIKIHLNRDVVNEINNASLNVNINDPSVEPLSYNNNIDKTPTQFELYNVSKNTGVTLKEEREAYSDLLSKEMEGPLQVTRFIFNDEGLLRFWVNVKLNENDSRIDNLMKKFNLERSKTVLYLEHKLYLLERKSIQYNSILNQLKIANINGKNAKSIKLIKDEIHFIKLLENEIKHRLPVLRQPLKTPDIEMALPAPNPVRSFFACSIATVLCAILSGALTGMGLLIKKRRCLEIT